MKRALPPLPLLLALVGLPACGDAHDPAGPTGGGEERGFRLEIVAGDGQTGAVGQLLGEPVRVRLVDPDGAPVAARTVRFEPLDGGEVFSARVLTGADGTAAVRWRLGDGAGEQTLTARSSLTGAPARVTANALPFIPADAVVVAGLPPGAPVGALVDGDAASGPADDFRYVGEGPALELGDWRGDGDGELTVFVPGGPVLHRSPPGFTASPDTVLLEGAEPAAVDLTVWLLAGADTRRNVEAGLLTAARIFEEEGLGAVIRSVEFVTNVAVPSHLLSFTCTEMIPLGDAVGRRADRINVYVVETVDGHAARGQACRIGGDFVAIARSAGPTLLAHEIGHNLSLVHVDGDIANFDRTNVMHSASDSRDGLSEGQILRAQLNAMSVLNLVYDYRDPAVQRSCYVDVGPECPPTELRLWADGPFGPWPVAPGSEAVAAVAPGGVPDAAAEAALQPLLRTCGLEVSPAAAPTRSAPAADRVRLTEMLEEGPPAWLAERWEEDARLRAEKNARWLAARGTRPVWLTRGSDGEAVDPAAAAAAARDRLRLVWTGGIETALQGRGERF